MSKIKLNSIQIKFTDGTIKDISIEDAKELFNQLSQIFGIVLQKYELPSIIEEYYPRTITTPDPIVIPTPTTPPKFPEVWCFGEKACIIND